jgi:hypothetical protein
VPVIYLVLSENLLLTSVCAKRSRFRFQLDAFNIVIGNGRENVRDDFVCFFLGL